MNPAREVRLAIRSRRHTGHTAGLAPGHVQGNLCILPREYAAEFREFCERNPKPCPLIGVSAPGDPRVLRSLEPTPEVPVEPEAEPQPEERTGNLADPDVQPRVLDNFPEGPQAEP